MFLSGSAPDRVNLSVEALDFLAAWEFGGGRGRNLGDRSSAGQCDLCSDGQTHSQASRRQSSGALKQRRATRQQIGDTFARLAYTTDLAAAVRDIDLISESVPESLPIKESFWREASRHAPARTVFTTNTSTLPPSALAGFVDRPHKFLALHFAIGVWDSNIGEVMGHPGTDPVEFERVVRFAGEIGLVPISTRREQNGYVVNSLIVPWCFAAVDLLVRGVSDFESIDRTWMITLRAAMGPFGMMDRMGLGIVYHVAKLIGETTPNAQALEYARYIDEHFIQKARLGVASGQGFYTYPDPAVARSGFLAAGRVSTDVQPAIVDTNAL